MEGRLATELRGRQKERGRGGGELLIMDWFSHFFLGLVFLSPSRWMVIAPPALIMCWIGKKTGGKRFYGNWESIALEVDLLLLRFIPPHHKSTHSPTHTPQTYMRAPMSEQRTEALITATSRWKRGQKTRGGVGENGGGEKVEQWGAGSHLGFRVSAVAGDWEEDNCFIKGVIAITSLILQRTKHLLPFVSHLASWLQSDKAIHRSLLSSS